MTNHKGFLYSPSFTLVWDNSVICFALASAGGGSCVVLVPQLPPEYDVNGHNWNMM